MFQIVCSHTCLMSSVVWTEIKHHSVAGLSPTLKFSSSRISTFRINAVDFQLVT